MPFCEQDRTAWADLCPDRDGSEGSEGLQQTHGEATCDVAATSMEDMDAVTRTHIPWK